MRVYIPDNVYSIPAGYYGQRDLVDLLRCFKAVPDAIQFIADMLE